MKRKNILANIALLLISITLFLVLFEVTVRLLNISPGYDYPPGLFQEDEILGYSMIPNFEGKFIKQEFGLVVSTNSYGLRDVEYSGKKDNEFRILSLGDSFTWGAYGTELNETYSKILEKKLNEHSGNLKHQVINTGVPGYGIKEELLYLSSQGIKLVPDLVILNFAVGNNFLNRDEKHELTVQDGILTRVSAERLRSFLLLHLHSYRIVEKRLINLFGSFIGKHIGEKLEQDEHQTQLFMVPQTDEMKNQVIRTEELLDGVKSFLDLKHVELVVVIIPQKYQVDDNIRKRFIKNNYDEGISFDMEAPQKIIREWGIKNDVFVIDLLPKLKALNNDNDFYWEINPHFNPKGNEVAGAIIFEELSDNGFLIKKKTIGAYPVSYTSVK